MIKTVFFDLHGVLVDPAIMHARRPQVQAALLADRYGGTQGAWLQAWRAVRADWHSYWVDLDLDGDDAIDHLWEGELRVLQALFRLTGTPYPPAQELQQLARELRYLVYRQIDAAYPETRAVVAALADDGYRLGVVSNAPLAHIRGLLEGAALLPSFDGLLVGSDLLGSFTKDADTYQFALWRADCRAEECLVVDDNADGVLGARGAGIHTVLVARAGRADPRPLSAARDTANAVLPDLSWVPEYVRRLSQAET